MNTKIKKEENIFCSQYLQLVHRFFVVFVVSHLMNQNKSMMECDEFNQMLVRQTRENVFLLILMIISQAIQICMKINKKEERKKKNKHNMVKIF